MSPGPTAMCKPTGTENRAHRPMTAARRILLVCENDDPHLRAASARARGRAASTTDSGPSASISCGEPGRPANLENAPASAGADRQTADGAADDSSGRVSVVALDRLDNALLARMQPDLVLSPLVSSRFDCMDLAQFLSDAGYDGAYRAISPRLPQPGVVRRELWAMCPGLNFDLIEPEGMEKLIG